MTERSQKGGSTPSETAVQRAEKLVGVVISGRYRIVDVLAVGGMGVVYRGQHVHMRKRLAIKILLPETKGLPNLVARFEREAVVGAHLTHPNIASATDFGRLDDGSYFLVLEYARGVTLSDLIKQGPMETVRAARIIRQLAAALDAAHTMGVIHRDMKPRNVMIDVERADFVKLIDFGLAKAPAGGMGTESRDEEDDDLVEEEQQELTTVGVVFGTVAYMSPEAALGMVMVDHRSDLYALGMMFYELLAGKHAWDETDPIELFRLQRMVMPPPISVRTPGVKVPAALESLITRLLQKEPDARFQSAHDFLTALDEVVPEAAIVLPPDRVSGVGSGIVPASSPGAVRPPKIKGAGTSTMLGGQAPSVPPPSSSSPSVQAPPSSRPAPLSSRPAQQSPAEIKEAQSAPPTGVSSPISTSATTTTTSLGNSGAMPSSFQKVVPVVAVKPRREGAGPLVWTLRGLSVVILLTALGVYLWRTQSKQPKAVASPVVTEQTAGLPAPSPASASPSATAATTAAAASAHSHDSGGAHGSAVEDRMQRAALGRQWDVAADALVELIALSPDALKEKDVAAAAVQVAEAYGTSKEDRASKVYEALAKLAGEPGLNVLYSVSGEDGKEAVSESAKRALAMLARKDVFEKEPRALQVVIELRRTDCMKKASVFDKVKRHGDMRSVAVLEVLRSRSCNKKKGECCFTDNNIVADMIKVIRERSASPK